MGLSLLGIFHTIIGIAAIIAAITAIVKYGRIDLGQTSGKIYFYTTLVTSLSALGFTKHGFPNPGHALSVLVIALICIAYFLNAKKPESKRARYWENFTLSFSFFLSLLPTVNETFTRVPLKHPLASGPTDPIIAKTLLVLFILFLAGSILQFIKQRKMNRYS